MLNGNIDAVYFIQKWSLETIYTVNIRYTNSYIKYFLMTVIKKYHIQSID